MRLQHLKVVRLAKERRQVGGQRIDKQLPLRIFWVGDQGIEIAAETRLSHRSHPPR